jgi:hypothetical protein
MSAEKESLSLWTQNSLLQQMVADKAWAGGHPVLEPPQAVACVQREHTHVVL